jgi:uncharacterized membrane protein YgdD (TMEM256/DUF423 family)
MSQQKVAREHLSPPGSHLDEPDITRTPEPCARLQCLRPSATHRGSAVTTPAAAAAGLAVAVGAESATYLPEEPGLAAADATVGLAFIALGVVTRERRPSSRSGLPMVATGVAWFAGSFADAALFLHRGPLVHLLVQGWTRTFTCSSLFWISSWKPPSTSSSSLIRLVMKNPTSMRSSASSPMVAGWSPR